MPSVLEINDLDELAGYRLLWNALLPETPRANFFQSLDWLEVYWRHFGRGQELRVLIVWSDGQPVGILPHVLRTESTRVGPVRVLTYPLDDWGTFYGPIGPNPTATLLVALEHIRARPRDWDLLDLRCVDADGSDRGRTFRAMQAAGFRPHRQAWTRSAVVDLTGTWEEYWRRRPAKWRSNFRRIRRRLADQGLVTHVRHRPEGQAAGDGAPRWDLYDACLQIARRSWQGASSTGTTLCHKRVLAFLRDAHARAAKVGGADLNLLLVDDRPIAFAYNYAYRGNVFGLRRGYDPAWAAFGPGTVLQQMILEDSFRRGDRFYDLGPGYLESKRPWPTAIETAYRYTHYPRAHARAQALRLKHWLQNRFQDQNLRGRSIPQSHVAPLEEEN